MNNFMKNETRGDSGHPERSGLQRTVGRGTASWGLRKGPSASAGTCASVWAFGGPCRQAAAGGSWTGAWLCKREELGDFAVFPLSQSLPRTSAPVLAPPGTAPDRLAFRCRGLLFQGHRAVIWDSVPLGPDPSVSDRRRLGLCVVLCQP